nr:formin-like protein 4 [Ipomoea batatas]
MSLPDAVTKNRGCRRQLEFTTRSPTLRRDRRAHRSSDRRASRRIAPKLPWPAASTYRPPLAKSGVANVQEMRGLGSNRRGEVGVYSEATKYPDFLPLRPASAPAAVDSNYSNYTGSTVVTAVVSSSAAIVVSAAIVDEESDQNCNPSYCGRYSQSRRERGSGIAATNPYDDPYPNGSRDVGDRDEFSRFGGKVKGVIVDEEGLDVLYWRNLESGDAKESFKRQVFNNGEKVEEKRMIRRGSRMSIHEIPLLRGKSSTSH